MTIPPPFKTDAAPPPPPSTCHAISDVRGRSDHFIMYLALQTSLNISDTEIIG